jgi:C1A family cysteine protease
VKAVRRKKPDSCPLAAVGLLLTVSLCLGLAVFSRAGEPQPSFVWGRPPVEYDGPEATGFVPTAFDLSHLVPKMPPGSMPVQPVRFDWRELGKVTSVKNQSSCGSCYSFASMGNYESRLLIDGEPSTNLSENNVKECEWWEANGYAGSCSGGNYGKVAHFLSTNGTVLETCDPYVPSDVSCNSTCFYTTTLLGWSGVSGDEVPATNIIKGYLQDYGPLYTSLYAGDGDPWYDEMVTYDGSYTLYHPGAEPTNHAVLIVGWDDTLSHTGGQGAWIVKNSWGTSWGGTCGYGTEGGYFTIAYGSASIGKYTSYVSEWQPYDPNGRLFYHDEAGFYGAAVGYGTTTGWSMCKFVPAEDVEVSRIEFWTTDATSDVDVYIYDDFNGSTLSNLLASELDRGYSEYGYHSVFLASPLSVSAGDDIYAAVKLTNFTYTYPIMIDSYGTPSPNSCYISSSGAGWTDIKTLGGCSTCDTGVRVRATVNPTNRTWRVPTDAPTIAAGLDSAVAGDTLLVEPGTYNEGGLVVDKNLAILSEAGPESTIVDAQNASTSAFTLNGVASTTRLDGFTIKCAQTATTGGGIYMTGSSPVIANCVVADNSVATGGGISAVSSAPAIENCTIFNNTGLGGIYYDAASGGSVTRCIIAGTNSGSGLYCVTGADPQVSCCDIYGNDGGDAVCGTDAGDNFSANPRLCDPAGDYHLQPTSPCARRRIPGLVGALDIGCGLDEYRVEEVTPPGTRPLDSRSKVWLEVAGGAPGIQVAGRRVNLQYSVPMPGRVTITVHDVLGRCAATLVDGDVRAGLHMVAWDGTDIRGAAVASGIYFARMVYGNEVKTLRIVLLR